MAGDDSGRSVVSRVSIFARVGLLLLLGGAELLAQPFQIRIQRDGNVVQVNSGATVELPASAVGATAAIDVTLVYTGALRAAIIKTELFGRPEFVLAQTAAPTLSPAGAYTFSIRYTAASPSLAQALLSITYQEEGGAAANLTLNLSGTAPQLNVSYLSPADNAYRPLTNGAKVTLPPAAIGSSTQATVALTNAGSGTGAITGIRVTGAGWTLIDAPVLPANPQPGQTISFGIRATPSDASPLTATVQIAGPGGPFSFDVTVTGYFNRLTYGLVTDLGGVAPLLPGSPISFPPTLTGGRAFVFLRVSNQTPGPIVVSNASLDSTSEFSLSGAPQLPWTIASGGSQDLVLTFAPTLAQTSATTLRIGSDTFPVSGSGLGSSLSFRYSTSQGDAALDVNGTVALPSARIGETSATEVVIRNQGTQKVTIGRISVTDSQSAFRLGNLPALPLDLGPQQEARIGIQFAPSSTGTLTGSLAIDNNLFTLRALATPPSGTPSFHIQAPANSGGALAQIAISAGLDAPYPVDLTGSLSISFDSGSFAADPAVQFSTGGRTVGFRIPAGSLKAIFDNGTTQVRLQTGSVAGDLQITSALQTSAKFDVTPPGGAPLHFQVPDAAPVLFGVEVIKSTAGLYTIQVLGMTTNRSLKTAHVQFTPGGKLALAQNDFTLDIQAAAASWFRSTTSIDFGGLFSLSIPLQVTVPNADPLNPPTLADVIHSITIGVSNAVGSSNAVSLTVQ